MPSIATVTHLDKLPMELIHKILNYLTYHDIYLSLYNISTYMNTILHTYDKYQLDFQSVSMSQFYITLNQINPCQVISLTLSNMDETPGQFSLFLSLFSIQQFSRLQSLQLIQPSGPIDLNKILIHLPTFDSLKSLAIIHCQPSSINKETCMLLSSFITNSVSLRRLYLSGILNNIFEYNISSSIDHLYFNDNICNTISLGTIASHMPHLKSLETAITLHMNYNHLQSLIHLTRLTMTIFINMKNSDLKILLHKMPTLVFFKLIASGKQWFDGQFWEENLPLNLQTFQFNFSTQSIVFNEQMVLETFQTPFWLKKKSWYVMLDYQMNPTMIHLYSLPYCDTQFYYRPSMNPSLKFRSSISNNEPYMNKVTRLTIDLSTLITENIFSLSPVHFFSNISTLTLADNECDLSVEFLLNFFETSIDLTHVTELKLGQFHHPDFINILYNRMPRLKSLRITEKLFSKLEMLDFHNIHSLTICDCLTNIDRMCSMFPNIKYLCVRLIIFEHIRRLMELLEKTLINITFRHINQELQEQIIKWLTKYCGKHRQYSYSIDQHMDLHIWLSDFFGDN
ncbi:unnamed protein product [Adineta steineri]|uniref:F-box domain-containing protein n=1 Tax=Adineta steineri TaxID=433720 RepID=A0A814WHS1_9BILA|nr:unnamed protein product [Adineta steineri]CAF3896493.1 unnamed protein product [Adineta steineri]